MPGNILPVKAPGIAPSAPAPSTDSANMAQAIAGALAPSRTRKLNHDRPIRTNHQVQEVKILIARAG
jgi:hypothetical protein